MTTTPTNQREMEAMRRELAQGRSDREHAAETTARRVGEAIAGHTVRRSAVPDNTGGFDFAIIDADGKIIGEAFAHVGYADKGYESRPAEANAKLWAAAPDLLKSLANVLEHCPHIPEPCPCVARARTLIAGLKGTTGAAAGAANSSATPAPAAPLPTLKPITTTVAKFPDLCPRCKFTLPPFERDLIDAGLDTERPGPTESRTCDCGNTETRPVGMSEDDAQDAQRDAEEAAQVQRTLDATMRRMGAEPAIRPDCTCGVCKPEGEVGRG